jgi:hypothetical protein
MKAAAGVENEQKSSPKQDQQQHSSSKGDVKARS